MNHTTSVLINRLLPAPLRRIRVRRRHRFLMETVPSYRRTIEDQLELAEYAALELRRLELTGQVWLPEEGRLYDVPAEHHAAERRRLERLAHGADDIPR